MGRESDDSRKHRIGRYRVDSVLGTGAFAVVYRAIDERLDDYVAIKILAENHSIDPNLRERFITEGRVLRRVDSRHVVRVYDFGETERQQPYLVLEFAARGTLAERVSSITIPDWRPTADELRLIAEPLALALQAIHQANVVHRDVNPANVLLMAKRNPEGLDPSTTLLSADERLVLGDLGMCKDLALNSGHTSAGGTAGFRPPELRSGPAIIDHRADLWSVSAVLVWLATGSPPGADRSADALVQSGVPPQLAAPLERGLAENPFDRQPDAATWLTDISDAIKRWAAPSGPGPTGIVAASRPELPATADANRPRSGVDRNILHSLWMITLLPLGLTTWAGFLYIGWRAKRLRWKLFGAVYGAFAIAVISLAQLVPTEASGKIDTDTWQSDAFVAIVLSVWIGGIVHGTLVNSLLIRERRAQ